MKFLKVFFTLCLAISFSLTSFAQEQPVGDMVVEENDSWDNDRYDLYIAPYINFGSVTDAWKGSYGIGVGIQKRHLFFGVFGELGDFGDVQMIGGEMRSTKYGVLGVNLGATSNPEKKIRAFGGIKAGYGYGDYTLLDGESGEEVIDDPDGVHFVRPEIGAEIGLGNSLRLAGHLGYDFTSSVHEFPQIEDTDLRKLNFGITLRLML